MAVERRGRERCTTDCDGFSEPKQVLARHRKVERALMSARFSARKAPPDPLAVLTVAQVCEVLQLGRAKVYLLLKSGDLESIKIGSARRIPREAVERFIAEHGSSDDSRA
jgi:excisionase family DNA binding protein